MLSVRVVKLGGHELDRPEWLAACADALKALGPVVLVHGGGEAVSALSRRLALPVEQRDGRRVTSPAIAEVVEMVLAGPVNRILVAALRRAGSPSTSTRTTPPRPSRARSTRRSCCSSRTCPACAWTAPCSRRSRRERSRR